MPTIVPARLNLDKPPILNLHKPPIPCEATVIGKNLAERCGYSLHPLRKIRQATCGRQDSQHNEIFTCASAARAPT